MTTLGDDTSSASAYGGSASVRGSVSGASDVLGVAHKHASPHIGQIDSSKSFPKAGTSPHVDCSTTVP